MDSVVDGIIVAGEDGTIQSFNPAAEAIFGYKAEEAVGRNLSMLMPEPDHARHGGYIGNYLATGEAKIIGFGREVIGRRKDGSTFPADLAISDVTIGGRHLFTGVVRDITERKRVENELKKAKEGADAANQAKSEFLSSMSHEMRTPMNAILGFGQLLESESLGEAQRESVRQILEAGEHLLVLINDVLDLVTIESRKLSLSIVPVGIVETVANSFALTETLAGQHGIRLIDDCANKALPEVLADSTRLKQILLNLLSNAVKYNSAGGTVTLRAEPTRGGMLRLNVTDTGPGINAEDRGVLFEPFTRLHGSANHVEGTGIGLAITKRLVELMSGRVGVDSTVGEGSTFWIELPVAAKVETEDGRAANDARANAGRLPERLRGAQTVLYVEDDPANLRLMEEIFERFSDLTLISVHNAELALDLAEARLPDLVLMDLNLPGISGAQALARLRRNEKTRAIPVIAISANAMPADVKNGMKAGFDGYLTKPLDIGKLLDAIKDRLGPGGLAPRASARKYTGRSRLSGPGTESAPNNS